MTGTTEEQCHKHWTVISILRSSWHVIMCQTQPRDQGKQEIPIARYQAHEG